MIKLQLYLLLLVIFLIDISDITYYHLSYCSESILKAVVLWNNAITKPQQHIFAFLPVTSPFILGQSAVWCYKLRDLKLLSIKYFIKFIKYWRKQQTNTNIAWNSLLLLEPICTNFNHEALVLEHREKWKGKEKLVKYQKMICHG